MENTDKKIILSGIQPSGKLTLGHYTGALRNWVSLQSDYNCYYMIADLHAITVRQIPADLRRQTLDIVAMFIAAGVDPEISVLFVQSHVPAHAELAWVLNTFTGMGECSRMTQFKDKSQQHSENINVGLFAYPVLMAADILLYQANLVPVGQDQKQHLELSRNLAQRFNNAYSPTFVLPEPYIGKLGARLMSLQEPDRKMSKSDSNEKNIIFLTDSDEIIKSKIKRAVTDSGSEIKYDEAKPGVMNLINMYQLATGEDIPQIEQKFAGAGYGDFKLAVADAIADYVRPIRTKYEEVRKNEKYLKEILQSGAEKASRQAGKTLRKVYKKIGFLSI